MMACLATKTFEAQATMGAVYRPAIRKDASRLYDIRRRSILALAPPTMPAAEAQAWAERLTLAAMERKLRELEVWVAELDGVVGGWGAVRGGYLEGLYTAPEFAGQGVGAGLLELLEQLMRGRGIQAVQAEASSSARGFYLRRGYAERGLAHCKRTSIAVPAKLRQEVRTAL